MYMVMGDIMEEWRSTGDAQVVNDMHMELDPAVTLLNILPTYVKIKVIHVMRLCIALNTTPIGSIVAHVDKGRGVVYPSLVQLQDSDLTKLLFLNNNCKSDGIVVMELYDNQGETDIIG